MAGVNNKFECPVCGESLNRNSDTSYWHMQSHQMENELKNNIKPHGRKINGVDEPKRRFIKRR